MKFISIVGARPQFIKVAALNRSMNAYTNVEHKILHTGQHYDHALSELFFKELEIPQPFINLNINSENFSASAVIMQHEIEKILSIEKPDAVIVFGDTTSTLAGAIAAKNLQIKLAHVEAGLRSFNNEMPEEFNRIQTDKLSDVLFCANQIAVQNLFDEGYDEKQIVLAGDVMLDTYNYYESKIEVKFNSEPFILCTLHRESLMLTQEKLTEVIKALNAINKEVRVMLPAHPRLKKILQDLNLQIDFTIIEPVGYLKMIALLKTCKLVMTDSGGLQKEAYFSKKICITLRNETEWTELVDAKVNFIAGDNSAEKIIEAFDKTKTMNGNFEQNFYGNGEASEIIVKTLVQ